MAKGTKKGVEDVKLESESNRKGNFAFIFMSFEIRRELNEAKDIDSNKFPKRHWSADHEEISYPSRKGHENEKSEKKALISSYDMKHL